MTHNEIMMTKMGESGKSFAWFTHTMLQLMKDHSKNWKKEHGMFIIDNPDENIGKLMMYLVITQNDPSEIFDIKILGTNFTIRDNVTNCYNVINEETLKFGDLMVMVPVDILTIVLLVMVVMIPKNYDYQSDSIIEPQTV